MTKPKSQGGQSDPMCAVPLCIRNIRLLDNNYWRFDLHWNTSAGVIRTRGWTWNPNLNVIKGPHTGFYLMIVVPDNSRKAIRKLFTRIMLKSHEIVVPEILR